MLETLLFAASKGEPIELGVGADGHITGGRVIRVEIPAGALSITGHVPVIKQSKVD